jgi:hypothetical protein
MPRRLCAALAVVVLLPSPSFAWGTAVHKEIMRRAIELLPPELKPYFVERREEMIARAIDPDIWRAIDLEEDPNHFVNFGAPELGPFPFTAYPREYGAALQKFGVYTFSRLGRLPFREEEIFGSLTRAFEQAGKGSGVGRDESYMFAAAAAHYLQDATQPLHAAYNYDGQLTDQRGVHARFEAELFERFGTRLTLTPAPPKAFASARDVAFELLLASYQQVDGLLKADKEAIGTKDTYDDAYFEAFFLKVKPMMEQRLSAAITATASMIVSAWEQAGRPNLHPIVTREPRKVQRAR